MKEEEGERSRTQSQARKQSDPHQEPKGREEDAQI